MMDLIRDNWVIVAGVAASAVVLLGPELLKLVLWPFKRQPADNTVEMLLELKSRLEDPGAVAAINDAIIIVLELDK